MTRVVITGIGLTTPVANNIDDFMLAVKNNDCGLRPIDLYDTLDSQVKYAGQCRELETLKIPNKKIKKLLNRKDLLNVLTATSALSHSGILPTNPDPKRGGVFVGSCSTQIDDFSPYFDSALDCIKDNNQFFDSSMFGKKCLDLINPLAAMKVLMNGGLAHISQLFNIQGVNANIINGETSGLEAIISAYQSIARGDADWCVAGAVSAPVEPFQMSQAFHSKQLAPQIHINTTNISKLVEPYSINSPGTCLGEGAVYFVLEKEDHAIKRNASSLGVVSGFGFANNGSAKLKPQKPSPALISAIRSSCKTASLDPDEIQLVGGQGHGGFMDHIELESLREVFGTNTPPVMTTTPITGYLKEANGPLSIAASLSSFNEPSRITGHQSPAFSKENTRKVPDVIRNCLIPVQSLNGSAAAIILSR